MDHFERFDTALRLAAVAHAGQKQGSDIPYLTHPVSVARMLERHGYDEWLMLAGLLHDVLEDGKFGDPVWQQPVHATFKALADAPAEATGFREAVCRFISDACGASCGHSAPKASPKTVDRAIGARCACLVAPREAPRCSSAQGRPRHNASRAPTRVATRCVAHHRNGSHDSRQP
jgi:hypothetical protein